MARSSFYSRFVFACGVLCCLSQNHVLLWAQVTSANRAAVKADFLKLAPLMSMDTELEIAELNEQQVVKKLKIATELATTSFDSEPTLERVGNAHIQYLIRSEANVIPMLRAEELDLGAVLVELASRAFENQALRAWQLDLDRHCRSSYEELLPLVKQLAGPKREARENEFSGSYGTSSISLASPMSLSNCTVVATFTGISKNSCKAYYFAPSMNKAKPLTLRVPSDFSLGPGGVVAMTVEIYADEYSIKDIEFELTDNAKRIVESAIRRLQALVQKDPIAALEQADVLDENPLAEPFADEIEQVRRTAATVSASQIAQLQESLSNNRKVLNQLRRPARMNAAQRANRIKMIEAKEAQIEKIAERIKLLREIN